MRDLEGLLVVALEPAVAAPYASSRLAGARGLRVFRRKQAWARLNAAARIACGARNEMRDRLAHPGRRIVAGAARARDERARRLAAAGIRRGRFAVRRA